MATSPKTRLRPVLWTLALVVASAGWWYLSVYQTRAKMLQQLVEQEVSLRRSNGEALEELTRLGPDKLRDVLAAYERQLTFVGKLLPVDTLTVELLPYVTEAASTSGVEIQGQRPVPRHREFGLVVDGITVTVQGGYHQVASMMTGLLGLPRITHLRAVQLRAVIPRGAPADAQPVTEATFTLVTFSRGIPTALPVDPVKPARPKPAAAKPAPTPKAED